MNVVANTYPSKRKNVSNLELILTVLYLTSLLCRMPCCEWRVRHVPATSSTQQNNTATKLLTVICSLKETVPRDFLFQVFFHESVFPKPLVYH